MANSQFTLEKALEDSFWSRLALFGRVPSVHHFLSDALEPETLDPVLIRRIEANPLYHHLFSAAGLQEIKKRGKDIEFGNTQHLFYLLGKDRARNSMASFGIARRAKLIPRSLKAPPLPDPNRLIDLALKSETFFQDNRLPSASMAFQTGLLFDLFHTLLPSANQARVKVIYRECFNAAMIALELGARLDSLRLSEFLFPTTVLPGLGRIWAESLYGGSYRKLESQAPFGTEDFGFWESKKLPLTHTEITSFIVLNHPLFDRLEKVVRFYLEPYRLSNEDERLRKLGWIAQLSYQLSAQPDVEKMSTPQKEILSNLGLKPESLKTLKRLEFKS